jgi:two-component system, cell cycle sensor histidine kinase and response regulator CckA
MVPGRVSVASSPQPWKDESTVAQFNFQRIEQRQWWLSSSGVLVTLILTLGIASFAVPALVPETRSYYSSGVGLAVRALVGLVLLFDVYVIYQQRQIYLFRVQLTQREELFRLISENAADMIALVDTSGRRLYNSPSYEKLLGYSTDELAKTSAYDQIHPDDREKVKQAAEQARRSGQGRPVEYRLRHKDGHWLTLESTASVVKDGHGNIEKLVIVNRDITERKQLEEQLYLSQKLEAIGRLSGGVAHDFNNLLGVIIGYSEALEARIPENDPFREAVDEIQKAGKRAASLTQQLLAFSRKQVLEPKALGLKIVIGELEKMLRRLIGEDIDLKIILPEKLGTIRADRGQIEQVLLNLVVNARDAMPQGGKLTIEAANSELSQSDVNRFRYVTPGRYVTLRVTDSGCGMDSELQSHIFEPFFTTKEKGKGTGLGLATVYGVIKQSGGYIWVDSEPGKGTTFRIYLPQVQESPEAAIEEKPRAKLALTVSRTILVVEDEQSLRKLTRSILAEAGYFVLEARDALQAIQLSKETSAAIDLLLTDVVMPGMSGPQLAEELSPRRREMTVLYMSGYTDGALAAHGALEPGISVLHKPFTRDQLLRRVEDTLGSVALR